MYGISITNNVFLFWLIILPFTIGGRLPETTQAYNQCGYAVSMVSYSVHCKHNQRK